MTGKKIIYYPRLPLLLMIRLYQKTISPDHGIFSSVIPFGVCKFHPTCSEYGYEAIKRYGIFKGALLSIWRILRCNPFSNGGHDPVPKASIKHNSKITQEQNTEIINKRGKN